MSTKTKGILFFTGFFLVAITFFIVMSKISDNQTDNDQKTIRKIIGNVQFKGKVINAKTYDFAGKAYYKICIRLDYCTVKNYFVLNDLCALSIKNGIATMSGSVYDSYLGFPVYAEVNLNRTGITKFVFRDGSTDKFEWLLHTNGLTKADLMSCN